MPDPNSLPCYDSIPDLGLYLDQTVKYIARSVEPLGVQALTPSMVSNYVKQHYIANPVHKQYTADQVAALIMIAVWKTVLGMDDLRRLCGSDALSGLPFKEVYEGWRIDFAAVLGAVFSDQPAPAAQLRPELRPFRCVNIAAANILRLQCGLRG